MHVVPLSGPYRIPACPHIVPIEATAASNSDSPRLDSCESGERCQLQYGGKIRLDRDNISVFQRI